MSQTGTPNNAAVQTDAGDIGVIERSDEAGGNQAKSAPVRSLATLRLLVRERMKVDGTPLPDGYVLPAGITLDDLLNTLASRTYE